MGASESVLREQPVSRQSLKNARYDMSAMQEKYNSFKITEDRDTDSMIIDRNIRKTALSTSGRTIRFNTVYRCHR